MPMAHLINMVINIGYHIQKGGAKQRRKKEEIEYRSLIYYLSAPDLPFFALG